MASWPLPKPSGQEGRQAEVSVVQSLAELQGGLLATFPHPLRAAKTNLGSVQRPHRWTRPSPPPEMGGLAGRGQCRKGLKKQHSVIGRGAPRHLATRAARRGIRRKPPAIANIPGALIAAKSIWHPNPPGTFGRYSMAAMPHPEVVAVNPPLYLPPGSGGDTEGVVLHGRPSGQLVPGRSRT
jgi:hypothetical protein